MLDKDFSLVQDMQNVMGKMLNEQGINPLHGCYLAAMAVREMAERVADGFGLDINTVVSFTGNAILQDGIMRNKMEKVARPADRPDNGCGCIG